MDAVLEILQPNTIWDYFIYIIFFLSLATLIFIPDKNMQPTTLMTVVLLLTVVDKLRFGIAMDGLADDGFATLLIHIGMFTLPLMTAGLIRVRGKKGRQSRPLAIFTGLVAGMYALAFFFSEVGFGL